MIEISEQVIDYFKVYNSRVGVIQITPTENCYLNIEVAKSIGSVENPKYDFENKITSSLSMKERARVLKMIEDFDKEFSKIPETRFSEKSIYIDKTPVLFDHSKSSKPKTISFQRQIYNGDKNLKKKQLTICMELKDKTAKYSKHMQSIDEEDYICLKLILEESIKREAFYNNDMDSKMFVCDVVLKGKSPFKMKLPKIVSAGDIINHKDRRISVLGREYLKSSNSWRIYGEQK